MHVSTRTALSPDDVQSRFGTTSNPLSFDRNRTPGKFFLGGLPVTLPAAAEVAVHPETAGSEVVLRLMWGPLPAPFPRVVAALGVLLGVILGAFVSPWLGLVLAAVPVAALLYQKRGESEIQSRLAALLEGTPFVPKPH